MSEVSNGKVIYEGGSGEIEEKKSRFIANIAPVTTEEEAVAYINAMKKKYWDARHNCSAFIIGRNQELTRCSDDGEPSGTAGRPMLDVLLREGIRDVVVVVTRYFGGTLLGTGGLVRAYQGAVQEGLKNCTIIEKRPGKRDKYGLYRTWQDTVSSGRTGRYDYGYRICRRCGTGCSSTVRTVSGIRKETYGFHQWKGKADVGRDH